MTAQIPGNPLRAVEGPVEVPENVPAAPVAPMGRAEENALPSPQDDAKKTGRPAIAGRLFLPYQ